MTRRAAIPIAVLAVAAAGCGGHDPRLARPDVAPLIVLSHRIAQEGPCAQKRDLAAVRARTIALVNRDAIPSDLQEPLVAGVNDLANRTPKCVPPPPVTPPPEQPAPTQANDKHPKHGHGKDHGHGHGEGD